MAEPDEVRAAAERRRLQEEADRIMDEQRQARLAQEEQDRIAEISRKRLENLRNADGTFQQR